MFTGAIKLANIDDYIVPSQQCIKPMMQKTSKSNKIDLTSVQIAMKVDNKKNQSKATITLNDCLACSGCITSAQSILVQQMSINQFLNKVTKSEAILFISVQSRASIANHYRITQQQAMMSLKIFMQKYFKITKLFDMNIALDICHAHILQQFYQRNEVNLPILCSECPGWVCYAQKVAPESIIKHMSKVKSPQQIMGNLIKSAFQNIKPYVVGIMPCYDKKLEAIRFPYKQSEKQVDLVLSSQQIIDLIKMKQSCGCKQGGECSCCNKNGQKFPYLKKLKQQKFQRQQFQLKSQKYIYQIKNKDRFEYVQDAKSNGYIHFLINRLGIEKYSKKQIRNSDFIEYQFQKQGKRIKMAKCYGFRNIQNVVKMIKNNKCEYVYIEIMACPNGCFNGGGQIKNKQIKPKDLVTALQNTLNQIKHQNKIILQTLQKKQFKIQYKSIDKKIQNTLLNW